MKKRILACLMACCLAMLTCMPVAGTLAEEGGAPAELSLPAEEKNAAGENEGALMGDISETGAESEGSIPSAEQEPTEAPAETEQPAAEPTEAPAETEQPAAEPTEAPAETEQPAAELTEAPAETEQPAAEPTEAPAEPEQTALAAGLKADVRSAYANENGIPLRAAVAGGAAPYTLVFYANGEAVETLTDLSGEEVISLSWKPVSFGVAEFVITVTDAEGASASAGVKVPVAVRDAEDEFLWDSLFAEFERTGDWRTNLVAAAQTQIGYQQSEVDFVIGDDGEMRFYSRYGDWNNSAYREWCASFISFCMYYAGIPADQYPQSASCASWTEELAAVGAYETEDYIPAKGDLVFFNYTDSEVAQHVGIVAEGGSSFTTIEGNVGGYVVSKNYDVTDECVLGFANTAALMELAGVLEPEQSEEEPAEPDVTEEPAQPEEETAEPEPTEAPAEEEPAQIEGIGTGKTVIDGVNVRKAPSTDAERVAAIETAGSEVVILAKGEVNGEIWYAVVIGEQKGYIRSDLLSAELNETEEEPSGPEQTEEPAQIESIGTGKTVIDGVNVRKAPSTDAERVAIVETAGSEVVILAKGEVNGETWYAVVIGEQKGYIRSDLLSVELNKTEEEPAAPTEEPVVTPSEPTLPEGMTALKQPESASWQPGYAEVYFSFEVDGAAEYIWQKLTDGEWTDIPGTNSADIILAADLESMKHAYRCVAADAAGSTLVSDEVTMLGAEYVAWLNEQPVDETMLLRALSAPGLDSLVFEGANLVSVRTGATCAVVDEETGWLTDLATGLVIAIVDQENGLVYPMDYSAAE